MILADKVPRLYLLRSIARPLLVAGSLVLGLAILDNSFSPYMRLPIAVPAFLGTAISLILAFRTGQAYDRWWEARKVWGAITNESRTWFRLVLNLMDERADVPAGERGPRRRLVDRQIAWNYVLGARLRDQDPLAGMERYLDKEELGFLAATDNQNQAILMLQSRDARAALGEGRLQPLAHVELEECLKALEAEQGKAERINSTVFPILYSKLIHVSILVFALMLVLSVVDEYVVLETAIALVVSGIFLALEEVARDMQDPFENRPTDTPVTTIAYGIERGALQMLGETEMPEGPRQGSFYLL